MQKLFLFLIILMISILRTNANNKQLVVWTKDNVSIAYDLNKDPVITFTEVEMHINGAGIEAVYSLEDFSHFKYEYGETLRIESVVNNYPVIKKIGDQLFLLNLKGKCAIRICTLSGNTILKKVLEEVNEYTLPMSVLNSGVIIVNVNGLTFKLLRK